MTVVELRDLLERVEKHGGPDLSAWVNEHELRQWHHLGVWHGEMIAVGVLKDDLIKRGATTLSVRYGIEIEKAGDIGWGAIVAREALEVDKRWWGDGVGHSELEAVLKAYLAAAEAEGWV